MSISDADFDAELQRRADARNADRTKASAEAKAKAEANRPDQYHAVVTGETFEGIAKAYGHDGDGDLLKDFAHSGGESNGALAASHDNLIRGANGEAKNERGILVPVTAADQISKTTKLTEGQSLLLPKGWIKTA